MGPTGCPETSVINYHYSLRNYSEQRSFNLFRGGSLIACIFSLLFTKDFLNVRRRIIWEDKHWNFWSSLFIYFQFIQNALSSVVGMVNGPTNHWLIPVGGQIFLYSPQHSYQFWGPFNRLFNGYEEAFTLVQRGLTIKTTAHFHSVPIVRMNGAIAPISPMYFYGVFYLHYTI